MSITLGPNGFSSDTTSLNIKTSNTTTVESVQVGATSTKTPNKRFRPSWGGYPNTGHGTGEVWSNYTVYHNTTNSGWNSGTGRFTAPVDGVYVLNMNGITSGGDTDIRYAIMKNGNANSSHCISSRNGGSHAPTNVTVTWYLSAGDYAECTVYSNGAAHGGNWNYFSGYYVG